MMLQQDDADDYVIATGETHTVQEFCDKVFERVGLSPSEFVTIDPRYYRPAEVDLLLGCPLKAKNVLGWEPKTLFDDLIDMMITSDLLLAGRARILDASGSLDTLPDLR